MLVKSTLAKDHVQHQLEMFKIIHKYKMILNPLKYTYGVSSEKFLSYVVHQQRIKANPE